MLLLYYDLQTSDVSLNLEEMDEDVQAEGIVCVL